MATSAIWPARDGDGRLYYYDPETKHSSWQKSASPDASTTASPGHPATYHDAAKQLAELSNTAIKQSVSTIQRLTADCDAADTARMRVERQANEDADAEAAQLRMKLAAAEELNDELSARCKEVLQQRDDLRRQLAVAKGKTSAVLNKMRAHDPSTDIAATIQMTEIQELLDLVGDAEEARELCKEVGLSLDPGLSIATMKAALKGHYQQNATVEDVFLEMDADGSGYLDEEEVQAAVAMLGFTVNAQNLKQIMTEMDPDGDGEVTLDEFKSWWAVNVADISPNDTRSNNEVLSLQVEVAALRDELAKARQENLEGRVKLRKVQGAEGQKDLTIGEEEARELIDLLDDQEEAEQLCREAGLDVDSSAKIDTMKAALKGHFARRKLSMEEVFNELDADNSGSLDADEVEQAVAMLGFIVDGNNVASIMAQMDPNGDGKVTLQEFSAWWDLHVANDSDETGRLKVATETAENRATELAAEVASLQERLQAAVDEQSLSAESERQLAARVTQLDTQLESAETERDESKTKLSIAVAAAGSQHLPSKELDYSSDSSESGGENLQATVGLLEKLLRARDEEVTELTAKLQSFAAETQQLLRELEIANSKLSKMADQYEDLEKEVEESDDKLDALTQKNLGLLGQISELQKRLSDGDRV